MPFFVFLCAALHTIVIPSVVEESRGNDTFLIPRGGAGGQNLYTTLAFPKDAGKVAQGYSRVTIED